MMLLTLFLSENTPIALAGLFLIVLPAVLILLFPVLWLSRPKSSGKAKLVAFGLALLPVGFGSEINKEFGWMQYGWVLSLPIYLCLAIVFVNLARSAPKS